MILGCAIESIGEKRLWKVAPHLNVLQTKTAARELETLEADGVPFADTLQEEKWFLEASVLETLHRSGWRSGMASEADTEWGKAWLWIRMQECSLRSILENLDRYMNEQIARAQLPYDSHRSPVPIPDDPVDQIQISYDPLNQGMSVYDQAHVRRLERESQSALLWTALALQSY